MEISEKEAVKEFEVLSFVVGGQEMAFDVDYVEIVIDKTCLLYTSPSPRD